MKGLLIWVDKAVSLLQTPKRSLVLCFKNSQTHISCLVESAARIFSAECLGKHWKTNQIE